ncbi:threonine ammonia-lyase [Halosolutus gelatinilyticus]|uniref:threonine ammonia-lyase n=1 Tax=Halosolutus gelatinilyticus TaxID=2931975 RepID=UPI001FF123C7|nr:threonine/serine dehydratase [Halosolutus gelatinilyticus]
MVDRYEPVESPDETTVFPYHDLTPTTTADVYRARSLVAAHLPKTPLVRCEWLSAELDADVYLKREDTLPTGAFKVRGGIHLVATLEQEFRDRGLVAASTGNHGQSIAYAGREFDVPVVICVPEDANPGKVRAIERLGARVEHHGSDFDEAREYAERLAIEDGYRYVHSANEPALIAGVATAGLEVVEERPDVDVFFSPIGGGSSAAGYCLTIGELTDADVIGVQSAAAPAMHRAWKEGTLEPHETMETIAEGVATRVPFALTLEILRERLDEFVLVEDDALRNAVGRMLEEEHILTEAASATGVAAALERREELAGKTVAFPVSGRNLAMEKLRSILEE